MWKSKKFIIVALLAATLVAGSIGGVVLAADNGDEEGSLPEARHEALLDRVCEILQDDGVDITPEQLKDALVQAGGEMRQAALESRIAEMVEEGVIDETQAQEYLEWWQARPDVPAGLGFGGRGGFRGHGGFCPGMFGPPPPAE